MLHGLAVLAAMASAISGQIVDARPHQPPNEPRASLAVVTRFDSGLASFNLVTPRPGSWARPAHKIPGWKEPAGTLPVMDLQVAWQLIDGNVRVTVSVLRGRGPALKEDVVSTIVLTRGQHLVVEKLRTVGVQPVDLALEDVAPLTPFLPSVVSITPEIEISAVELLPGAYPGYRVTVRNLSSRSIAYFHFQSYRGAARAISAVPRGPGGRPAMRPGESFVFDVPLSGGQVSANAEGPLSPASLDVLEIDSVHFDDDTVIGDAKLTASGKSTAAGAARRGQLTRAVAVLRNADVDGRTASEMIARVDAGLETLPEDDDSLLAEARASLRDTRMMVINDLRGLEAAAGGNTEMVRAGIRRMIQRYEDWIRRLLA